MIPVQEQQEPTNFDQRVRQPGLEFLNKAGGSIKSSRLPSLWQRIKNDLHGAYGGICAYTCVYLVGTGTVDHFLPKKANPWLAYEWSNYRLSSERTNSRKGEQTGILDPFEIESQWFELLFPACLVVPGEKLPPSRIPAAERTIELLKLNDDDDLVQERCNLIMYLRDGIVQLGFLERRYPFIAHELKRQDLMQRLKSLFKGPSWRREHR